MIKRQGQISKISGQELYISFTQSAMCAHCQIKENCLSSAHQKRELKALVSNPADFQIGETVEIEISTLNSTYALLLGYGLPLIVLLGVSFLCSMAKLSENTNALSSIAAVIIYYIWLSFYKKKLEKKFHITVHKIASTSKIGCNW